MEVLSILVVYLCLFSLASVVMRINILAKILYSSIKYWASFTAPNTLIHQIRNGMCRFMNPFREGWTSCWLNCIGYHSPTPIKCSFQSVISVPECLILNSFCLINYVSDYCYFDIMMSVITESVTLDLWSFLSWKIWL